MRLAYGKYRFIIEATERLILPFYKGSTFRGGFGNAFRRVVCALRRNECKGCLLSPRCVFAYVFETAPGGQRVVEGMLKYEKVPHPFVIEPPLGENKVYEPGEKLEFFLVLVGKAVDYLPYFVYTFEELGKVGLGKGRGTYRLLGVTHGMEGVYSAADRMLRSKPPSVVEVPEVFQFDENAQGMVHLRFLTPARLVYRRRLASDLPFDLLITNLLRRLMLLAGFHGTDGPPSWDHRLLIRRAAAAKTKRDDLHWRDWTRYSARQATRMKLGGLIGEIVYEGDIQPYIPILRAGEILHVGKGTSFGLGQYELVEQTLGD